MQDKSTPRKKLSFVTTAKLAIAGTILTPPAIWSWRATSNAQHLVLPPEKDRAATYRGTFDHRAVERGLKEHMCDVILSYYHRDGAKHLSAAEVDYGKSFGRDLKNDYTVLYDQHTERGFYGALLQNKKTGKTSLVIAGMDFSEGIGPMLEDIDDGFMLTSGGWISQLPDAVAFAKQAQSVALTKTGKPIDAVAGHSLGAFLGAYLAAGDALKGAHYYLYDGPGINTAFMSRAGELFGLDAKTMEANLRNHVDSFTFTHNSLNTIGAQPGRALTENNLPTTGYVKPERHIYTDRFIRDIKRHAIETVRTDNETSQTSTGFIAAFLLASLLPFMPYRRVNPNQWRRKPEQPDEGRA